MKDLKKMRYFLNISNHPSDKWGDKQRNSALEMAEEIIDLPFPNINPDWDTVRYSHISSLENLIKPFNKRDSEKSLKDFPLYHNNTNTVVMVMGEMCYTHYLVNLLQGEGYTVVCATTERNTVENADGTKTVKFEFCKFRTYETPKKEYFDIFGYYRGIALIKSRLTSISKPAGERRQGSEYSTGNYEYGYIAYDKSGEICRQIVDSSLEEVIADCKKKDFKIISEEEWNNWMLNAGLNPALIFEGMGK